MVRSFLNSNSSVHREYSSNQKKCGNFFLSYVYTFFVVQILSISCGSKLIVSESLKGRIYSLELSDIVLICNIHNLVSIGCLLKSHSIGIAQDQIY